MEVILEPSYKGHSGVMEVILEASLEFVILFKLNKFLNFSYFKKQRYIFQGKKCENKTFKRFRKSCKTINFA